MIFSDYNASVFGLNIENVNAIGQKQVTLFSSANYTQDISITGNIQACYGLEGSCYSENSLFVPNSSSTTSILVNANITTTDSNIRRWLYKY